MKRDYPKLISMLLVVASLVCIIILFIIDINVIFEPPYLLPITNTIFTAIIPVVIAFFAAKTYLRGGPPSVFLMGCGMFSFCISAALAGWLRPAQNGANINVTIYNTGALIGALFHIAGAVLSYFGKSQWEFERRNLLVASAYSGIFAFIILFTFATFERVIPPFFIQGYGPTALRQVVLGVAIFFYLLSAIFFMDNYLKVKSDFFYWYSLGLTMLAFGLFAFYIQKGVGSPVGWAGRTTNYIGAIFALVAVLIAIRSGRFKGLALEDVISSFFRDAEANFRSLVETATDAIISYDQEDRIILWNAGAERIFGYTKEEAVGAPFFKLLFPEEYSPAVGKLIMGTKSSAASVRDFPITAEIEMKKKDGSRLPVEISAFRRKLPTGFVSTCILRDITDRKRAEEELKMSEEKSRLLIKYAPSMIYEIEFNGPRFIRVNDAMCSMLGYAHEELLSRNPFDLLEDESKVIVQDRVRKHLAGEKLPDEIEYRTKTKDGRILHVLMNVSLTYKDGKPVGAVVVGHDITERKEAEKLLAADLEATIMLQKLGSLYLQAGNLEPVLTEIVDSAIAISGADFGNIQLLDPRTSVLKIIAHRGFPQWWIDFWNNVSEGQGVCGTALGCRERIIVEDVEQSPIFTGTPSLEIQLKAGVRAVQSTPLMSRSGRCLGMFSTHYKTPHRPDDRALRLLDLLARHAADIIDRALAEEEIKRHAAKLEEANKELESFSYSVSHDLRAPLRAIDGYSRMILKKQGDKFDEDTRRRFNEIRSSTQMMGNLVDDLLDFSRLGRKEISWSKIDMAALIGDAWKELPDIQNRSINLTVNSMPSGYGDRILIKQVFLNLLSNAVKFTKNQDIAYIEAGGYVDGNEDIYYVKDNGVGFDMQYYDKLFGVFQRLHNPDDFEGTGIGLAIVHRIISRHGGRVWAEGKEGQGATFYFSLAPPQTH